MQNSNPHSHHWNSLIHSFPSTHLLQTWEWAQVKKRFGWKPFFAVWYDNNRFVVSDQPPASNHQTLEAADLILKRTISMRGFSARLCVLYIPKGPLVGWNTVPLRSRMLDNIQDFARNQNAIFIKLDPDLILGTGIPNNMEAREDDIGWSVVSELKTRGWQFSDDQIQFRNTILVDLSQSEDALLARMKQKTRYNIRLSTRKSVFVRIGTPADFPMLYKMYAETSVRDGFVIRDEDYYKTVWQTFTRPTAEDFTRTPSCEPLIAEVSGEPVAALFVFYFAEKAYYLYGMSREAHREKMPNYLLQWEAIKRAREKGCRWYDLWGAPDSFNESDPLWGVFRFKEGLGGEVVRTLGAWDYAPNRLLYRMYTRIIPRVLDVMRTRGKAHTRQEIGI